jgi:16S rRNA (guanine527-N7)-methyltransferase
MPDAPFLADRILGVSRETPPTPVSRETRARLEIFAGLLLRWNTRINLISPGDESELWTRHIEDSLQLVPLIPPDVGRGIDLGSGAGFPGLVVAIATGVRFDLVEADLRKAAFLREAARAAGAPVTVHADRAEHVILPPSRLVTARALAPLPRLLSLATRFMTDGSVALFQKGENADQELTDASRTWNMQVERHQSRTGRGGVILRISEVKRAR